MNETIRHLLRVARNERTETETETDVGNSQREENG